jgi:DNA-binding NarL/FixJ family response regulator
MKPLSFGPAPFASEAASRPLRVLVLDDNRETLAWIAETMARTLTGSQIRVATSCAEAQATLFGRDAEAFDVALIDLELPDGNGVDIVRAIARGLPDTLPVVITIFDDDASLFDALAAGAQGYILKGVRSDGLAEQFRRIEAGEPPISPRIAQRMIAHFQMLAARPPALAKPEDTGLSARETEVLRLLGKGLTVAEIGGELGISTNTCASHTKAIYRKLNISSRAEAALAADRRGLI